MELSTHYIPFRSPTLFAITNHERARILRAHDRIVEELPEVSLVPEAGVEPLGALYQALDRYLASTLTKGEITTFRLCVPEINRPLLQRSLSPEVTKHVEQIIPKNLANMDLPNIMRILLET